MCILKLNSVKDGYAFINIKREDFPLHLMQHLSHHLRNQTPFPPQLRKSTGKGKLPCRNSKPAYFNIKRSDQVVISRLSIGHSKLTYTYLLTGEQKPKCIFCDFPLSLYTYTSF